MVINVFLRTAHVRSKTRTLACIAAASVACVLSACGGSDSGSAAVATTGAAVKQPVSGSAAPMGAGGAASEVPIVAPPASGPCAASGTTALQSPLLNSQLNCAP